MLLAERLAKHASDFLSGRIQQMRPLLATPAIMRCWCESGAGSHSSPSSWRGLRHSVAGLSGERRGIRRHSEKLVAINCGYETFRDLTPRDWLSLAGI